MKNHDFKENFIALGKETVPVNRSLLYITNNIQSRKTPCAFFLSHLNDSTWCLLSTVSLFTANHIHGSHSFCDIFNCRI